MYPFPIAVSFLRRNAKTAKLSRSLHKNRVTTCFVVLVKYADPQKTTKMLARDEASEIIFETATQ